MKDADKPGIDDSRYHRQREEAKVHPNRKQKTKPYHDTERPYIQVAEEIEDAIARFKTGRGGPGRG